jgi:hypothetical protein
LGRLPWFATPSRRQASGRMYDVRASRNAPALRRAPACSLFARGAPAQGRSSGESRRHANTDRSGACPLGREKSVVLVRPARELDGMPAWRQRHAGGRTPRPAWWSTAAGSPVEDAGNFDSSPLPSKTALTPSRALVRASVHGADGSHLDAAASVGVLLLVPLPHRNRIEVDRSNGGVFCRFESSDWSGRLRQALPFEHRSSHTNSCGLRLAWCSIHGLCKQRLHGGPVSRRKEMNSQVMI